MWHVIPINGVGKKGTELIMRKFIVIAFAVIGLLALSACDTSTVQGSGTLKTETRNVSGFSKVSLSGTGNLVIQQAPVEALTVTAEDNILPLIQTTEDGDTLVIKYQDNVSVQPTRPIVFALTAKSLTGVSVSGEGTVTMNGINTPSLDIHMSGAGDVTAHSVSTASLNVNISGAANVTIDGQTTQQSITISGAGKYQADKFTSKNATINISGSGSGTVNVQDTLNVTITGEGDVKYIGNPAVTQHITGTGSVTKQGG